jgi:hypothetical protein
MRSTDETDASEEEYGTENKIDKYLFYIAHAATRLHKINRPQNQSGYAQKSQYYSNDPFFHCRFRQVDANSMPRHKAVTGYKVQGSS